MSRRLHALRVGNFKAFADTQRIPLKPITLIFGPNSAGKSSFIHSLALAHEAQFGRDKRSLSRLDVHHTDVGGSAIDLGGFRQYVHRGQLNKRVEWGAELNVSALDQSKDQRLAQLLAPVSCVALNISLGIELDDQDRPKPGAEPRVDAIEITADGTELLRMSRRPITTRGQAQTGHLRLDRIASDHAVFQQVLKAIVETQTTSEAVRPEDFNAADKAIANLLPELEVRIDQFFPSGVELIKSDGDDVSSVQQMLFPISKGNRDEDIAQAVRFILPRTLNDLIKGLSDALASELGQLQYLGPLRSFPPRHLAFAEHEDVNWYAGGGYAWDIVRRDDEVRAAVNKWLGDERLKTSYRLEVRSLIDTRRLLEPITQAIAPQEAAEPLDFATLAELFRTAAESKQITLLRKARQDERRSEHIKRMVEQWRPRLDQAANDRERTELLAEVMSKINESTFEEWMDDALEAHELEVDAEREQEDLANDAQRIVDFVEQSNAAKLRELVLFDINKETLVSHRDVGMGITQVLPVLVMAYGSRNKLLAMEQPEIHLHPALQAELGDVFIESALGERGNTFILETHSEHLILRLLRRVREGRLSADDISVLYVQPADVSSQVLQIRVDEDGDFIDRWPGGFFEEAFNEREAGR